ncbi:hypothetical protein ROZALSC1DRAFT_22215 [Rozella allomycis CSF55]|uniref:VASt domain-containing protein n=1 Tax=Rozella allomycis (strain CSF55) TaxID=988480 RepID=A0A4P9YJF2_ROZAC|nr:hypothetical protein ROZALSC1DRAFT_22215 [Rozella allomycis CSF55]
MINERVNENLDAKKPLRYPLLEKEFKANIDDLYNAIFDLDSPDPLFTWSHRKVEGNVIKHTKWENNERFVEISIVFKVAFMPKCSSTSLETHKLLVFSSELIVLHIIEDSMKVPYGDCFKVQMKYVFEKRSDDRTNLTITGDVNFTKKCVWESRIEKGALDGCVAFVTSLNELLDSSIKNNHTVLRRTLSVPATLASKDGFARKKKDRILYSIPSSGPLMKEKIQILIHVIFIPLLKRKLHRLKRLCVAFWASSILFKISFCLFLFSFISFAYLYFYNFPSSNQRRVSALQSEIERFEIVLEKLRKSVAQVSDSIETIK